MLSDIIIYRDVPVVDDYVQPAGNYENGKNGIDDDVAASDVAGSVVTYLTGGSGRSTGGKSGIQRFLRMPGLTQGCCTTFATDPIAKIETAAPSPPSYPL